MTDTPANDQLSYLEVLALEDIIRDADAIAADESVLPQLRARFAIHAEAVRKALSLATKTTRSILYSATIKPPASPGAAAELAQVQGWLRVAEMICSKTDAGFTFDRGPLAGLRLSLSFTAELPSVWVVRGFDGGEMYVRSWLFELDGDVHLPPNTHILGEYRPALLAPMSPDGHFDWLPLQSMN